ncbi:MAG TPA: beta-ketoacyl synthase N-terminal-like domain-containing protein, partial [Planctomycetota bacterium]|nr:beta-ketoacyl synthase N-terminal-like domain-containing protein [Planctomycetota bacterium]
MTATPWAVTAAVARSAAGRWLLPAAAGTPAAAPDNLAAAWHWPSALAPSPAGADGEFRFTRLTEKLRNNSTPDRACNLALDLADDLRIVAPLLTRWPAERVGCSITVSKGAIGPLVDALDPHRKSDPAWRDLANVHAPEAAAGWISERLGIQGPRITPVAACATGVANLASGARLL